MLSKNIVMREPLGQDMCGTLKAYLGKEASCVSAGALNTRLLNRFRPDVEIHQTQWTGIPT